MTENVIDVIMWDMLIIWGGYGVVAVAWFGWRKKKEPFAKLKTADTTVYSGTFSPITILCEDGYWRFAAQIGFETTSIKSTSREYVEKMAEHFIESNMR
jgi:hypothetical protein